MRPSCGFFYSKWRFPGIKLLPEQMSCANVHMKLQSRETIIKEMKLTENRNIYALEDGEVLQIGAP